MRFNMNVTMPVQKGSNVIVVPKTMSMNGDTHFTASEIESLANGKMPDAIPHSKSFEGRWKPAGESLRGFDSPMQSAIPETKPVKSRSKK